jgi:hypothetical protein
MWCARCTPGQRRPPDRRMRPALRRTLLVASVSVALIPCLSSVSGAFLLPPVFLCSPKFFLPVGDSGREAPGYMAGNLIGSNDQWIYIAEFGQSHGQIDFRTITAVPAGASTVTKSGRVTTTVTGPSAPPAALVTTCLGAGIVLLLTAAFFSRISKVVITGVGEIDLNAAATLAGKVAEKSGGDPAKAEELYKTAASQAAGLVSQRLPATTRIASFAHVGWNTAAALDDQTLQKLVDDAAAKGAS